MLSCMLVRRSTAINSGQCQVHLINSLYSIYLVRIRELIVFDRTFPQNICTHAICFSAENTTAGLPDKALPYMRKNLSLANNYGVAYSVHRYVPACVVAFPPHVARRVDVAQQYGTTHLVRYSPFAAF